MTKREREISDLIADGLSNKEIALQINVATYTVKSHVHNILEKRGLHSRLEIARYAYEQPRLIRVNEAHPHSLASSSDHTGTFPANPGMAYRPMRTS
jgi:DNA-binding CsgD family transcriptional regulator